MAAVSFFISSLATTIQDHGAVVSSLVKIAANGNLLQQHSLKYLNFIVPALIEVNDARRGGIAGAHLGRKGKGATEPAQIHSHCV